MREKLPILLPLIAGTIIVAVILWVLPATLWSPDAANRNGKGNFGQQRGGGSGEEPEEEPQDTARSAALDHILSDAERAALKFLEELRGDLKSDEALDNEAILTFANEEAYKEFLKRAEAAGLTVLDKIDALNTARVRFDNIDALSRDVASHLGDYSNASGNFFVYTPTQPTPEERELQYEVGFGDATLSSMGVPRDHATWGQGKTIAVLDSGIMPNTTFGQRVKYLDVGQGTTGTAEEGHATAVAALAAGAGAGTEGVAPGSTLLSIRVTGADGLSDTATLSKAIIAAVDAGANVINISLGAYETNTMLGSAIAYAAARGVPIVAAGGNDQAGQLTWPAADPRTISVGSVDALGQRATFSNAGADLKLTAPGVGLYTAWPGEERVAFDGTSGSAPLVAGSLAAILSQNPTLNAWQAADLLYSYANEAGAPGVDRDYGNGILDFAGIVNRLDPAYADTAVASHYLNKQTGQMQFTIENRGNQLVDGMTLETRVDGVIADHVIPGITPRGIYTVSVPVNMAKIQSDGSMEFRSMLRNPDSIVDRSPQNNGRVSEVFVK